MKRTYFPGITDIVVVADPAEIRTISNDSRFDQDFITIGVTHVVLNPVRAKAVDHPRLWAWSSYRATGGLAPIPRCLTVNEILNHFGQRRSPAQQKYRSYVAEGVSGATIWENLEAQSLLGVEGFAEALRGHVTGKQKAREIPEGQRLIGRPRLDKLFEGRGKKKTAGNRTVRI